MLNSSQAAGSSVPTDVAGVTGQLSTWLAGFSLTEVPERVRETSQPRFAVDPDFLQALTNSVVNL